jgi:hypothetical protein
MVEGPAAPSERWDCAGWRMPRSATAFAAVTDPNGTMTRGRKSGRLLRTTISSSSRRTNSARWKRLVRDGGRAAPLLPRRLAPGPQSVCRLLPKRSGPVRRRPGRHTKGVTEPHILNVRRCDTERRPYLLTLRP